MIGERPFTTALAARLLSMVGTAIAAHWHLKKRARGTQRGESIVAMAEAAALRASCLDDLAIARGDHAQEGLRGFAVPAPQTAGAFLRRFTSDTSASSTRRCERSI